MASTSGAKRANDSTCPSSVKRFNNQPSREIKSKDALAERFGFSDKQLDSLSDLLKKTLGGSNVRKEWSTFLSELSHDQSTNLYDFLSKCDKGEWPGR